jgi:hypothetical protein
MMETKLFPVDIRGLFTSIEGLKSVRPEDLAILRQAILMTSMYVVVDL